MFNNIDWTAVNKHKNPLAHLDLTGQLNSWGMPNAADNYFNGLNVGNNLSNPDSFKWGEFLLGGKDRPGALSLGLQTLGGLGSFYTGMKQYGQAKKALKQQNEHFEKNYAAQRNLVNSQLEDRQRARVASNPGAYESVGTYMDKNRIR